MPFGDIDSSRINLDKEHSFTTHRKYQQIEHCTMLVKLREPMALVEAMNKKVKANTTKRFYYDTIGALKKHVTNPVNSNFNLNIRVIGRKTPFDEVLQCYAKKPDIFIIIPIHMDVGLNIYRILD